MCSSPQLLKVRHIWLEFFAHVGLFLVETESRSKEHTGLGSSTDLQQGGHQQKSRSLLSANFFDDFPRQIRALRATLLL